MNDTLWKSVWTEAQGRKNHILPPFDASLHATDDRSSAAVVTASERLPHTKAVASKRHLEYEGDDGASIFDRQREALDRRAQRNAVSN